MIAPIHDRPTMSRMHSIAIEEESQDTGPLVQTIEKHPGAALAVATSIGLALGWLLKRYLK